MKAHKILVSFISRMHLHYLFLYWGKPPSVDFQNPNQCRLAYSCLHLINFKHIAAHVLHKLKKYITATATATSLHQLVKSCPSSRPITSWICVGRATLLAYLSAGSCFKMWWLCIYTMVVRKSSDIPESKFILPITSLKQIFLVIFLFLISKH